VRSVNHYLCGSGEKNGAKRGTKVSFGKTMMQNTGATAVSKMHVSRQSDVEQCKNQAHSLSGY